MSDPVAVRVAVTSSDLDDEQLDDSTRRLRSELLDLDVEHVTPAVGASAPTGTRSVDAATVGQLIVGIGPSLVALRQLLETLRGWRSDQRNVEISVQIGADRLELAEASADSERALVDAFIDRHAEAAGS